METQILNLIKQHLIFVILGAMVLLQVVLAVIFWPDMIAQVSQDKDKNAEMAMEISRLKSVLETVNNLPQQEISNDANLASETLPNEKKISGIISSLTTLASSSGVAVDVLELTPCRISTRSGTLRNKNVSTGNQDCENVKLEQGVSGVPLTMRVEASGSQLQEFLSSLYQVSPLLGITKVDYNIGSRGETANLALLLYFQPVSVKANDYSGLSGLGSSEKDALKKISGRNLILP